METRTVLLLVGLGLLAFYLYRTSAATGITVPVPGNIPAANYVPGQANTVWGGVAHGAANIIDMLVGEYGDDGDTVANKNGMNG